MIAQINNTESQVQNDRILYGIRKAFYKLVLKSAAKGETLILENKKSGKNEIPAKEVLEKLLKEYPEEIKAFHNDGFPL